MSIANIVLLFFGGVIVIVIYLGFLVGIYSLYDDAHEVSHKKAIISTAIWGVIVAVLIWAMIASAMGY